MARPTTTQINYVITELKKRSAAELAKFKLSNPTSDTKWIRKQLSLGLFKLREDNPGSSCYLTTFIEFTSQEYLNYLENSKQAAIKQKEFDEQIEQVRKKMIFADSTEALNLLDNTSFSI